jgi:ubiquinol-cytochrome c reductase cytochrome b subunit
MAGSGGAEGVAEIAYHLQLSLYTVTWVFRVLVLTGPVLAFALTRMFCHAAEARRRDEAEHGIETGRIVMTPEGGFTEIREPVAPLAKARSLSGSRR